MTTMDNGNAIIAKFMNRVFYGHYTIDKYGEGTSNEVPTMKYHSSWDWLMPVIEKISKIEYERYEQETFEGGTEIIIDTVYPRTFGMISKEGQFMFRYNRQPVFLANTLIEAAYLATVDFIKNNK